jgi:hypothetical protein
MPKYRDKKSGCNLGIFGQNGECKRAKLTPEQMALAAKGIPLAEITQAITFNPSSAETRLTNSWHFSNPDARKHLLNKFRQLLAKFEHPCNNDDEIPSKTTMLFTMFTATRVPHPCPPWCKWERLAGSKRYIFEIDFTHPDLIKAIPPAEEQPSDRCVTTWLKKQGFPSPVWLPFSFRINPDSPLNGLNEILPTGINFDSWLPSYILPKKVACFQIRKDDLPKKLASKIENFLQGNPQIPSSIWCAWRFEGVLAVPAGDVVPVESMSPIPA